MQFFHLEHGLHDFTFIGCLDGYSAFFEGGRGQIAAEDGFVKFHGFFGVAVESDIGIELGLHRFYELN